MKIPSIDVIHESERPTSFPSSQVIAHGLFGVKCEITAEPVEGTLTFRE
jgi:hypothetical protein